MSGRFPLFSSLYPTVFRNLLGDANHNVLTRIFLWSFLILW